MARWVALLLLLVVIAAGLNSEPLEIERKLHGNVVLALADEDLSAVRVELDGRHVVLSGPEYMLSAAKATVAGVSGVQEIETLAVESSSIVSPELTIPEAPSKPLQKASLPPDVSPNQTSTTKPDPLPLKTVSAVNYELSVTKINDNVEVIGKVPNNQIKQKIHTKIEHLINVPEHMFNVTVNLVNETPVWVLEDLPLIIPFVQWVDEGKLKYQGNRIFLEGMVLNKHSWKAIEVAIRNIPSQFQIENKLKIGAD